MTETTDLPSEATIHAWARLVRVSQDLIGRVEADLKAAGHPPLAWYDVLLELRRAEPDRLRPYQLQERLLLAQYNMSRLLDRMAKAGLIQRVPCEEDGRGHILAITNEGQAVRRAMWPVYARAIARHFGDRLTAGEAETLTALLAKLKE
ncbi:MAG: winged helix-turn-helix transcriptional regulator [Alphaproteobacteria bacterium]|uniref:MarR family winged helix-turn-helix transcriptional regulator n=1 Tax=Pacificispira sp. TaxID=2888761 RepID=UPI001B2BB1A6|nr:winged helix-turn-helix transcriptional regulator [Alphaproteobacteria bacterium]MBO6862081.1 winged helix-turn-helix transcriptional regulator [Alphaproteobacteria bacterium]